MLAILASLQPVSSLPKSQSFVVIPEGNLRLLSPLLFAGQQLDSCIHHPLLRVTRHLPFCYRERMRFRALLLALACSSTAFVLPVSAQAWGVRPDGSQLTELAPHDAPAVVLFFVASDCPISNRTFPEMSRLREKYRTRGVRFWFVYPNAGERPADITAHQTAFDPGGEVLQDPAAALVRLSHAVATPEMAVLIPAAEGWQSVYTGRIDNRYIRLGLERPAATVHFGDDALSAVLAGRKPRPPLGAPVGCAIMNSASR